MRLCFKWPNPLHGRGRAISVQEPTRCSHGLRHVKKDTVGIPTPTFDDKANCEYNGCTVKAVVLLTNPGTMKASPPTNDAELDHPALGLLVQVEDERTRITPRTLIRILKLVRD